MQKTGTKVLVLDVNGGRDVRKLVSLQYQVRMAKDSWAEVYLEAMNFTVTI